jgi:integrase
LANGRPPQSSSHARPPGACSLILNQRSLTTFGEAFATYYERRVLPNYRSRTAKQTKGIVERHAGRLFDQRLTALTPQLLASVLAAPTIPPMQANHLYGVLRTFFKWAQQQDMLSRSPLTFPKPHKEKSRSRVLSDQELAAVYHAAQEIGHPFGYIILLCIHCGFRKNEAANLKWSYITPEYIALPANVTKNGHEHALPNLVADKLKLIPRTSEYLFASAAGTPFSAWTNSKIRLDRLSGVYDWCIHDLRRTFSSKCAEWGVATPDIIERLLGHTTALTPIARVYNKWHYLPQMRAALEAYQAKLGQLFSTKPFANPPVYPAEIDRVRAPESRQNDRKPTDIDATARNRRVAEPCDKTRNHL